MNECGVQVAQYARCEEVLWRRTSAGVVLLPSDGGSAVTLGGLHASVWENLARPSSVEAMALDVPIEVANEAVRFLVAVGAVRESSSS